MLYILKILISRFCSVFKHRHMFYKNTRLRPQLKKASLR